jgi:hypothetical protein
VLVGAQLRNAPYRGWHGWIDTPSEAVRQGGPGFGRQSHADLQLLGNRRG